ncbi:AAA family ATPase [Crossiella sp. CA-258035]|uniref:AAA family ATPase n=1 Tax=Crossiella sp. CA-258035 TaxID=2981138 RepID=UPI0024BC2E97|nr:AAA family ATPase [Crossiella sp. CA-258035]WHT17896.1 AAA family ATPase [Crossiella sp. CA-258035]
MINHRSFRDEHELSLLPAYEPTAEVVPVAAVYGANASGKSNLLSGLRFMAAAVTRSFGDWPAEGGVPRRPFRLDPAARAKPSGFVVELISGGVPYTYGFTVDDVRVCEEWLYSYPEGRKRKLFERNGDTVRFGSTVPELRGKLEVLEALTRPNALFLSLAAQSNITALLPVHRWFAQHLTFRLAEAPAGTAVQVKRFLRTHPERRDQLVDLLRAADLGISGIAEDPLDEKVENAARDAADEAEAAMAAYARSTYSEDHDAAARAAVALVDARHRREELREVHHRRQNRLQLTHGELGEVFDLEEESAGTRSWLALLPTVLVALAEGTTLVVDEIDTSLHPRLTARLVSLFQDLRTNPRQAQLIFTTHDTSLLGTMLGEEVLRRDQVWFVQKDPRGASTLYPLTDFHPRKDENTERRYLGGSYGAVPVLSEQDFIDAVLPASQ